MSDHDEKVRQEAESAIENRRRKTRVSMLLMATVRFDGIEPPMTSRILDLSSGGVRISAKNQVPRGHKLRLQMKGVGEIGGKVAWCRNGEMGIQFDIEIDTTSVVRALTGLPITTHIDFAKGPVPRPGFRVR